MRKIILIAVDIRSIHNVGSFFRSADGFGAQVVLTGITPRPKGTENDERLPHVIEKAHKTLHKTALGAEETVRWRYYKTFEDALAVIRKEGYRICAIEQAPASKPLSLLPRNGNIALVMGPEVEGLSEEKLALCDDVYEIAMSGNKESFNVSVAAGIALYQANL